MTRYAIIALLLLAAVIAAISWKSDEELLGQSRQQIRSSCLARAGTSATVQQAQLAAFCDCSADKVVAALGVQGVRQLQWSTTPLEADHERMKAIGPACLAETAKR